MMKFRRVGATNLGNAAPGGEHSCLQDFHGNPGHLENKLKAQASLARRSSKYQRRSIKCVIFGCTQTLLKPYDKKSRTCAHHRKEVHIELDNVLQRFCQQCSRFHPLTEFEGEKRTCRQRLLQHNCRQRKTRNQRQIKYQSDNLSRTKSNESHQTSTRVGFYEIYPAAAQLAAEAADVAAAEPFYQVQSPEIDKFCGFPCLLSSEELDVLLSPFMVGNHIEPAVLSNGEQNSMLLEISSAAVSATDLCTPLEAEDVWPDEWY